MADNTTAERRPFATRHVSAQRCGAELSPVVIVDQFVPEPEALVELAGSAEFADRGEYYPGPRAPAPKSYVTGIAGTLAAVAKNVFGAGHSLEIVRSLFSVATHPPERLSLAQRIPHIDDLDDGALAVVHYLAPPGFGGTAFYRHRSTGFERVTAARHAQFLAALKRDFVSHGEPPPAYINGDTPAFERIFRVEAVFNRAVIYHGNQLHCAELPNDAPLPEGPRDGRLTIATFLKTR